MSFGEPASLNATGPQQQQPFPTAGADVVARVRLRRNRAIATGMLVAMLVTLVAARLVDDPGFLTLLVRSTSEAGLVGGLADWFAVTALFRQPLGLPIPHTAIIPNNKERIGRALGRFVERNFLTPEVVLSRVRQAQPGRRFAAWLVSPQAAGVISSAISTALPYVVRSLRSRDMRNFVRRTLGEQLRQADLSPAIGSAIRLLASTGQAEVLFEHAIGALASWLRENRGRIDSEIGQRSPWWVPRAIDRRIAAAIFEGALDLLNQLQQPNSEARIKFRGAIEQFVAELLSSPERREQINAAKDRILGEPKVQAWLASVWREISQAIAHDIAEPSSRLRTALENALSLVAHGLHSDQQMQKYIDDVVEDLARSLIAWRGEIGSFIAEVIRNWDTRTVSERLELVVGSDLQYIRMNGTIVGASAGCLLFVAGRLIG